MVKLTKKQCKVINALAFSSMNVAAAQRVLGCARNGVEWHINRIKALTGLDPRNFFDLHELYKMTEEGANEQTS